MELVSEPNFVPVSEGRVPHSVTPKDCLEGDNIAYKIQYCGIILIREANVSWILKNFLVCGDMISWVTVWLHYNARQFITLLTFMGT